MDSAAETQPWDWEGTGARGSPVLLREEAHRMTFGQLFKPEQDAVLSLVEGLIAANHSMEAMKDRPRHTDEVALSPSFFLSGQRGTGKTTVLVNARFAVEAPKEFFVAGLNERAARLMPGLRELRQHVVWLDPLDMEFFHREGNLLTTLLVRLRNALVASPSADADRSGSTDRRSAPRRAKVLEEVDDAWTQIDELIKDATVMWEAIPDPSASRRAELEIRSAETNADFRARFQFALNAVCAQLARRSSGDGRVSLILPIDNADRSSRHVFQIVRLIRMVSCPPLWYVLAGGEEDLDVFLERSYQEQLLGARAGADGQAAAAAEQLLAIARRQAASDARAVLPPSSRISIDSVHNKEALSFQAGTGEDLEKVLADLGLAHLLKLTGEAPLSGDGGKDGDGFVMSQAGEAALKIPARAVVDTYQLARLWREKGLEKKSPETNWAAVGFIHAVLRHAIAESSLPMWATGRLNQIITEDGQGRIGLDLRDDPLEWRSRVRLMTILRPSPPPPEVRIPGLAGRTSIEVRVYDYHGVALFVRDGTQSVELPGQVSGWLRVLYDVLKGDVAPRIVQSPGSHPAREPPWLVETWIRSPIWVSEPGGREMAELALRWPVPEFDSFLDYDRFARRWAKARHEVFSDQKNQDRGSDGPCRLCSRLLNRWLEVVAWVADLKPEPDPKPPFPWRERELGEAFALLEALYDQTNAPEEEPQDRGVERARAIRIWLERDLPILIRPELMSGGCASRSFWARKVTDGQPSSLMKGWQRGRGDIYAACYATFINALEQSEIYRHYERRTSTPQGLDYRTLHRWLRRACDRWFREAFDIEKELRKAAWYPGDADWSSSLGPLARTSADAARGSAVAPAPPSH